MKNRTTVALLALCAASIFFSYCLNAQMTTTLDRSKPPVLSTNDEFLFPEYSRTTLSNGVQLILVEDHTQPLLSVHLVLRRGAAYEQTPGLASFTAQLLTRGTTSRSAQQIADEMDFLGGSLSASASWDTTTISMTLLTKFALAGLNVFADVVKNASFPEEEIERYRQQALSYLQQNYVDPTYLASTALRTGMYGSHTYGHAQTGTIESVTNIKHRDCVEWYNSTVTPGQAFIVATGNVTIDQLRDMLETALQDWTPRDIEVNALPAPEPITQRRIVLAPKSEAAQSMLLVGFFTPKVTDPDYPAMQFLNTLLGSMFISRLNAKLREEKGYTYGVNSYIDARILSSTLVIGTSVGRDVTLPAVQDILAELERLEKEPISDEELNVTKKYMLGSFALRTATPNQVISLLSSLEMQGLPEHYYEEYYHAITGLTKEKLFEVQKRRFSTERLVIAASGDIDYLQDIFKELGTTTVVTAEGVAGSSK